MKAAVYNAPRNITTEEVAKPEIDAKGILIKVKSCCICGSDLHMYKLGLFEDVLCRKSDGKKIPGHEFSGEIVEVGAEMTDFSVGDRVVAYTNGGMAEYVPVGQVRPGINVHKIPDEIDDKDAATLEPLANSLHAAKKGNPADGENAMVFGAGIIGLGVIQALKALDLGLNKIIAVDVSDKRLEMAQRVGADAVIVAGKEDIMARAIELTGSEEYFMAPGTPLPLVDIVYDCVGYMKDRPEPPVLEQGIWLARPIVGRIVTHGIFEAPLTLEFSLMVGKEIQIIGSYGAWPDDSAQSIDLMRSGKVDRSILISHEYNLDQAGEAFETQATVADSIKVVVNP